MKNRRVRLYLKLIIIVLCFLIVIRIFSITLSKYESESNSNANIDIAFFLLKEDYQSMSLNLGKIFPREEPYIYTFEITNEEEGKIAEVDLEYNLNIRTTTNLPLSFKLYMNEDYRLDTSKNIIINSIEQKDEYGTYFKILQTEKQEFVHSIAKSNIYTLLIYFPKEYNTEDYQDIIDFIEITIDAKQVLDEST